MDPSPSSLLPPTPTRSANQPSNVSTVEHPESTTEPENPSTPQRSPSTATLQQLSSHSHTGSSSASGSGSGLPLPPLRRHSSTSSSKHEEELIQSLEAEEERLVNVLTRKLEKLRAEKIALENTLEAESENLVNRLQKQLTALKLQQQQQVAQSASPEFSPTTVSSPLPPANIGSLVNNLDPLNPSSSTLIEALKTENSNLRARLAEAESAYIRKTRENDSYLSELIRHRTRLGLPIDDLVGTASEHPSTSAGHARRSSRSDHYLQHQNGGGVAIPGAIGSSTSSTSASSPQHSRRRSTNLSSPLVPSANMGIPSSSLPPSTPLSSSSYSSNSPFFNAVNLAGGNSNSNSSILTTPSTSFPGPPVPHSTPITSPITHIRPLNIVGAGTPTTNSFSSSTATLDQYGTSSSVTSTNGFPPVPPPSLASSNPPSNSVSLSSSLQSETPFEGEEDEDGERARVDRRGSWRRSIGGGTGGRVAESGQLRRSRGESATRGNVPGYASGTASGSGQASS